MKKDLFTRLTFAVLLFTIVIFSSCAKNNESNFTAAPNITIAPQEYFNYTVNGIQYFYNTPTDSVFAERESEFSTFIPSSFVRGRRIPAGSGDEIKTAYLKSGIAVGSSQPMTTFNSAQTGYVSTSPIGYGTFPSPIMINITEYGNVGAYISGNFSGQMIGAPATNTVFNVSGSFKVKRLY